MISQSYTQRDGNCACERSSNLRERMARDRSVLLCGVRPGFSVKCVPSWFVRAMIVPVFSRCFRSFVSGHALLLHRSSVHGDRSQFRCNFCGHSFGDGSTYSAHLEKHRIAGAIYQCSCSRVLRSDAELRHHLKAHDTGTGHRCSLCGRLYECRASLKIHVAKHKARKKLSLPKPPQSPSGSG